MSPAPRGSVSWQLGVRRWQGQHGGTISRKYSQRQGIEQHRPHRSTHHAHSITHFDTALWAMVWLTLNQPSDITGARARDLILVGPHCRWHVAPHRGRETVTVRRHLEGRDFRRPRTAAAMTSARLSPPSSPLAPDLTSFERLAFLSAHAQAPPGRREGSFIFYRNERREAAQQVLRFHGSA